MELTEHTLTKQCLAEAYMSNECMRYYRALAWISGDWWIEWMRMWYGFEPPRS